jgi:hypothetical protein
MLLHIGLGYDYLGGGRDLASSDVVPTQASTTYPPSALSTEDVQCTNME